jgi:hypothetical protein
MFGRGMMVIAMLLLQGSLALASEKPFRHLSCSVVRFYVAKYSVGAAESYARSRGATDVEIESARKCLGGSAIQAANFAPR